MSNFLTQGGFVPAAYPSPEGYAGKNVIWVSSGKGSTTNPGTRTRPVADLDSAINLCTANQGDLIVVMENHSETLTAASAVTVDKAGIRIVGLGNAGQRPNFLMDAAAATVVVSAADVVIENLEFTAGFADVVTAIDVTAADVAIVNCEFSDNTTAENFLTCIKSTSTTDNTADGLSVIGCRWVSIDAGCLEFIEVNGDVDRMVLHSNFISNAGTASKLLLCATGKDLQGCRIHWNYVTVANTTGAVIVENDQTDNDGIMSNNYAGHLDTAGEALITANTGIALFENYGTAVVSASGYLVPAADVNL